MQVDDALTKITDEVGWEHVAEIMFDSTDGPELECLLCKAGDRAGAFMRFMGMTLAECVADVEP